MVGVEVTDGIAFWLGLRVGLEFADGIAFWLGLSVLAFHPVPTFFLELLDL
jgi:hypothetical protein